MLTGIKLALLPVTNMTTISGTEHKMLFSPDYFLHCFCYPKKLRSAELQTQPGKQIPMYLLKYTLESIGVSDQYFRAGTVSSCGIHRASIAAESQ